MSLMLCYLGVDKNSCAVVGDFNINLLKINEREVYSEYFDLMVGSGFFPQISLPTRFSKKSCTLIDQIFIRNNERKPNTHSGIWLGALSDHLACISYIDTYTKLPCLRSKNIITKRIIDQNGLMNFYNELVSVDMYSQCYRDMSIDPNINYNIVHSIIQNALNIHLPIRTFRFNKYKHKANSWITNGILRSLKYRDKLYAKVKSTLNLEVRERLACNLKSYNNILRKSIRNAKQQHYSEQFSKYSNDMKQSWNVLKSILNKTKNTKHPSQMFFGNKKSVTPQDICHEFNSFFSNVGSGVHEPPNSLNERNRYLKKMNHLLF